MQNRPDLCSHGRGQLGGKDGKCDRNRSWEKDTATFRHPAGMVVVALLAVLAEVLCSVGEAESRVPNTVR